MSENFIPLSERVVRRGLRINIVAGSLGMAFVAVAFGVPITMLLERLGASGAQMGLLVDRIGARAFGAFLFFACPLMGAAWWFVSPRMLEIPLPGILLRVPQPVALLGVINIVSGALYSSVGLCHLKLLGALTPKDHGRTVAMAVHWTLVGLIGAAGPWLGGRFMDRFPAFDPGWTLPLGGRWSFFHFLLLAHALICWFAVAPLMLKIRRKTEDLPFGTVMARLRPGNPLRAVGMLYDMWLTVSTDSSHTRVRAIRRLGAKRAAVAVRDLIRQLDDASAAVREEAALALGHIGGEEAVVDLGHRDRTDLLLGIYALYSLVHATLDHARA